MKISDVTSEKITANSLDICIPDIYECCGPDTDEYGSCDPYDDDIRDD